MVSKRVQTLLEQLRAQGIRDEHVLEALAQVPREKFVDEAFEHKAWENVALPIGQGQTISQPYMVARMTELLEQVKDQKVPYTIADSVAISLFQRVHPEIAVALDVTDEQPVTWFSPLDADQTLSSLPRCSISSIP